MFLQSLHVTGKILIQIHIDSSMFEISLSRYFVCKKSGEENNCVSLSSTQEVWQAEFKLFQFQSLWYLRYHMPFSYGRVQLAQLLAHFLLFFCLPLHLLHLLGLLLVWYLSPALCLLLSVPRASASHERKNQLLEVSSNWILTVRHEKHALPWIQTRLNHMPNVLWCCCAS